MANVGFIRENIRELLPDYCIIRDCLNGQRHVKKQRTKYLPDPEPMNCWVDDADRKAAAKRYDDYITRAVFYNVTSVTLAGLVGQVFMRDPVVEVPAVIQAVIDDATGSGVSMKQVAVASTGNAVGFGRSGLYVDYPSTNLAPIDTSDADGPQARPASKEEIERGDVRPTVTYVDPEKIINYRKMKRGSKLILKLIVFKEDRITKDDGFEEKKADQYRVLRLDEDGLYVNEVYYGRNMVAPDEQYFPVDSDGKRLDEIPFKIIGAVDNEPDPDKPPLIDMANLNIAHYRNSADYEEAVFITGQPTPVFSGLTEEWVKNVLGGAVRLGSRAAITLPVGGEATLLQAEPNTLAKEAMDQKEAQMLGLGAKLVEGSQVERTATEAEYDNTSETSTLSTIAKNVSEAMKWALDWCARYAGASGNIKYELNTEFDLTKMSPDERRQLLAEWQANGISWTEYRENLRRAGVASLSDKAAEAEIDQDMQTAIDLEAAKVGAVTAATNENTPPEPSA